MLFAQRIKKARTEKGLLQKELAIALNIDIPMYSRIERGDRLAKRE
ncbi:helix-turn-helix domain-containing protein [Sanguibacteroides justesenii]|nr:helix-turn-helix transcriptional regulator [Sanguibacteroides justesenii]